jgi:hypothetical protein
VVAVIAPPITMPPIGTTATPRNGTTPEARISTSTGTAPPASATPTHQPERPADARRALVATATVSISATKAAEVPSRISTAVTSADTAASCTAARSAARSTPPACPRRPAALTATATATSAATTSASRIPGSAIVAFMEWKSAGTRSGPGAARARTQVRPASG